MSNTTTDLLEKIKQNGLRPPDISKRTGIPVARIYKWYAGGASPKYADIKLLKGLLEPETKQPLGGIDIAIAAEPTHTYRTSADFDLRQIVGIIQAVNNWTQEQVAQSINYTRVSLGNAMDRDDQAIKKLLTDKFGHLLKKVPPPIQTEAPCGEIVAQMQSQIERLEADKKRLEKLVDFSLNSMEQTQLALLAYQKAAHLIRVQFAAGADKKLLKQLQAHADKVLAASYSVKSEKDSQVSS